MFFNILGGGILFFSAMFVCKNKNMRISSYNICVELDKNEEYNLLFHGYTGAIDLVKKDITTILKSKNINCLNRLPKDTIKLLERRGYLTKKSLAEERKYVKTIINKTHFRKSKKRASFLFIVTNDCNFRCTYCFENFISGKGKKWSKKVFTKDMVDKAYNAMLEIEPERKLHSDNIYLYGGEPLMKENYKIVEYIIKKGKKRRYKFHAITNGYDIDTYIDLLGPGKIESLQITIDGMKENHNRRRKHYKNNDSFSRIIDNLNKILETGVNVSLRINSDESNFEDIKKLAYFFMDKGWFKKYRIKVMAANTYRECSSLDKTVDSYPKEVFIEKIVKLKENDNELSYLIGSSTDISTLLHNSIFNNEYFTFRTSYCGAMNGMKLFDPEGKIYSCFETIGYENHIIATYNNGVRYTETNAKWRNRITPNIKKCFNCKYALICGGGCPGKLATSGKSIYLPNCDGFSDIFKIMANYYYNKELKNKNIEMIQQL